MSRKSWNSPASSWTETVRSAPVRSELGLPARSLAPEALPVLPERIRSGYAGGDSRLVVCQATSSPHGGSPPSNFIVLRKRHSAPEASRGRLAPVRSSVSRKDHHCRIGRREGACALLNSSQQPASSLPGKACGPNARERRGFNAPGNRSAGSQVGLISNPPASDRAHAAVRLCRIVHDHELRARRAGHLRSICPIPPAPASRPANAPGCADRIAHWCKPRCGRPS